jgi:membrane-bound lytic murein transglycosylase B
MPTESRLRGRTLVLTVAAVIVLALAGLALYATTRPPPVLLVRPVDAVVKAPPASGDRPSQAPARSTTAQGGPSVSPQWVAQTAAASGIPAPAVRAYGVATLRSAGDDPGCHLAWTTLAGIGWVESQQGTIGGRTLGANGRPDRPITGVPLDGSGKVAQVPNGSGGYQRAIGPMQFIPSTWQTWASDGDGDGVADPQDLDDAAYAAARYLCASGDDLATGAGWSAAVLSYNHSDDYVRAVYDAAKTYAARTS